MTSRLFWKLYLTFAVMHVIAVFGVARLGWGEPAFRDRLGSIPWMILAALLLVTWWVVDQVIKPATQLTRVAEKMADGDYDEPIYLGSRDELGLLARAFNTMRQEMESRLSQMRDTNQRLSAILGGMTDGVIAIDESQTVQFANSAAGKMLGFSAESARNRTLIELVRNHKLHALAVRLLASKGHGELELEWGEENPQTLLVSATSFSGDPSAGILMMFHNLSEVRHLETMRRDFVANVSHELKTPLSSIKAYAETLRVGAINDEANRDRFVHEIEAQADRLHQLISDLLSLARIEQGNQLMELGSVQIEDVVTLCVREQQRAAQSKAIELAVKPSAQTAAVEADQDGLRQIVINLVDNAIKYTPENGKVTIGWTVGNADVLLFVQDTGIGIPKELLERVFERFFRVDKARSRELGGTGLGLAIVKHLVQGFGGTVEVESEVGIGTRFSVRLPKSGTVTSS